MRPRKRLIACVAALTLATGGCVDLEEIAQFAEVSQGVGKAFPVIADEAAASCNRANSYITEKNQVTPLPCEIYPALKPSLVKVNAALFNYIASLGKLASADSSNISGGWDSLPGDLEKADPEISPDNQAAAAAASELANAITNLLIKGYRRHEVSKIIGESNTALQEVTRFLSSYAAGKYHQSLADEWRYERSYCDAMATTAEPLATDLLGRKCNADKSRIDLQLHAIEEYKKSLATIAETHKKLDEQRKHWDAKQLSKDLGPAIISLGNAAVSMSNAF
jgi:hypothetical protein